MNSWPYFDNEDIEKVKELRLTDKEREIRDKLREDEERKKKVMRKNMNLNKFKNGRRSEGTIDSNWVVQHATTQNSCNCATRRNSGRRAQNEQSKQESRPGSQNPGSQGRQGQH